jgi:lipid-A-disaccharide synthase-like uncharacterized protein
MNGLVTCFFTWRNNQDPVFAAPLNPVSRPSGRWKHSLPLVIGLMLFLLSGRADADSTQPFDESSWTIIGHVRVGLDGHDDDVRLVRLPDGREMFLVRTGTPREQKLLTGEELLDLLKSQSAPRTWAHRLFQTSGTTGFVWVGIGLAAQLLFAGRMIVQWIVSERSKRSIVPVAFWWISLTGASMLLLYFLWRRDVVGILGQSMGWMIYVRNLVLIYRSRHPSE